MGDSPQQLRQFLYLLPRYPLPAAALLQPLRSSFKKLNQQMSEGRGKQLSVCGCVNRHAAEQGQPHVAVKEGMGMHRSSGLGALLCPGRCVCDGPQSSWGGLQQLFLKCFSRISGAFGDAQDLTGSISPL